MKTRASFRSTQFQMILLSFLPVMLSCHSWNMESPTAVAESVLAEILAAAVSDPTMEDCKPLVLSRSGPALGLDEVTKIARKSDLRGLGDILKELERVNAESRELEFPSDSPIVTINEKRQAEIFAQSDPWGELQRSYPESCQLTKISWPVVYDEGDRAAVYIIRSRGLLAAEVSLLILRREGTRWAPLRSVLLYVA